jgi:hypothetical protein
MRPDEFELRINELLDERRPLGDDAELVRLSRDSAELSGILASYSLMLDAVAHLPIPLPSDDLTQRIVAAARQDTRQRRTIPLRRAWTWGAAAAAAAAILALPWLWSLNQRIAAVGPDTAGESATTSPNPRPLAKAPAATQAAPAPESEQPRPSVDAAKLAPYAEFARKTTSVLADLALLVSEISVDPQAFAQRAKAAGDRNEARDENETVVEQVSETLKPLTNSVGGALDFLLEVLPAAEAPRS